MKRILMWAFFICLTNAKTFAQVNSNDSLALVDFYNSTSGATWAPSGWLQPGNPVANWEGITVTGNRVTEILLETVTGNGSIPASIGDLDALKLLSIRYNNLTGTLPSSIGNLAQLEVLTIMQDFDMGPGTGLITGTIPASFVNLTNLKNLTLEANGLSGSFPMVLTQLPQLRSIFLGRNQFTGPLPDEIGNITMLESLSIRYNAFSGSIPTTIGNLTNLNSLDVGTTQLSGTIPAVISNLSNLRNFWASGSLFEGPIPTSVCSLFLAQVNFDISNNLFNFDDLACIASNGHSANYPHVRIYGPQPSPILNYDGTKLSVTAGGQLSKNTYKWFRNSTQVATITGDSTYTAGPGIYYVIITNTDVKDLSLQSTDLTVAGAPILASDSLALVDLFNNTNGSNWINKTNWLVPGKSIPEWYGVTVMGNRVTRIELENNRLTGSLPETIGDLAQLKFLNLSRSRYAGVIPQSIGSLSQLEYLDLRQTDITGAIPSSIGNLTNLVQLDLSYCKLSGEIPQSIGNLVNLNRLTLYENQLNGALPQTMQNMVALELFSVDNNKLSGSIAVLCSLPQLRNVGVSMNSFTFEGMECVRHALSENGDYFGYNHQVHIPISHNNSVLSLSAGGTLANNTYTWYKNGQQISTQTGDSTLTISTPGTYYATISNSIATDLTLQTQTFKWVDEIGLRQDSLALVDLYNSTNGPAWANNSNWLVPGKSINEWYGVQAPWDRVGWIDLSSNNLNGPIPESIGDLTELHYLFLWGNQINGAIPSSIGNLSKLTSLSLSYNNLTGTIPSTIVNATQLVSLEISDNAISGNIPVNIGNLTNLTNFNAGINQLSGSIPESFGSIPNLREIYLESNQLTGNIPASLGGLTELMDLSLANNQLSGSPAALSNIQYLWGLGLGNNRFTFEGIEAVRLSMNSGWDNFSYAPQAKIPITNNNPTLSVSAGGTLAQNFYTWYKDDVVIAENAGDSTFTISEPGTYYVEVYNAIAYELVLTSEPVVIGIVESASVLPLDFVDVKATTCANGVCVEWKTSNEQNTSHFEVEASTNGSNFKKLGNNVSSRNTTGIHNYNAADNHPATGYNYYRIKQVDKDGAYKYSKTVSVNISLAGSILAAPNPTTGSFMLKGLEKADRISVYNVNGQLLKQWQNINGNKQLSIANLSNGLYTIKIEQGKKQTIIRLLKQ